MVHAYAHLACTCCVYAIHRLPERSQVYPLSCGASLPVKQSIQEQRQFAMPGGVVCGTTQEEGLCKSGEIVRRVHACY